MDYRAPALPQPDMTATASTNPGPANVVATSRPLRATVRYRLCPRRPEAHLFALECEVSAPAAGGETFALPAWIPGSYLLRDFARHIVSFAAEADGQPAPARKLDQHRWHVPAPAGCRKLVVRYEVYAWDLSVRGAHLDESHAFFNGTSVFLRVLGREQQAHAVHLEPPPGAAYSHWRVATTLPPAPGPRGAKPWGFGHFQADSYTTLIDHPVEMGDFDLVEFSAAGIPHAVAITGRHRTDGKRLARDLAKVCTWQQRFWGKPAPFARYLFLVTAVGEGYGGLEHRDSTALLCRRDDLPNPRQRDSDERYRTFLGLASHEYFHSWLVKRLRPAEFAQLDLQRENPTELLWLFEGFTSYYDDLALLRCGLFSETDYLTALARTIAQVATTPGRQRQSVAQASFDAWSKYYRPDENSPNATVSYYAKGTLVALALDLTLRQRSAGKLSLDDVMHSLWADAANGQPDITEKSFRRHVAALAGSNLDRFFREALHGTGDLPLARLLASHGITMTPDAAGPPSLGIKLDTGSGEARLAHVYDGGAAMTAGLAGGDVLLALDGLRVTAGSGSNLNSLLARYAPGDSLVIHAFRRDELISVNAVLQAPQPTTWTLRSNPQAAAPARRLRTLWLAPAGQAPSKGASAGTTSRHRPPRPRPPSR